MVCYSKQEDSVKGIMELYKKEMDWAYSEARELLAYSYKGHVGSKTQKGRKSIQS